MILTSAEQQSEVWFKIKEHYESKLNDYRKMNDSISLDIVKTATIRGKIAEVKAILSLEVDVAAITFGEDVSEEELREQQIATLTGR